MTMTRERWKAEQAHIRQVIEEFRVEGDYDEYGYPRARHWECPVCGQPLSFLSPPQAMARAVIRHRDSAKHRKAL